jgi:transaldolase
MTVPSVVERLATLNPETEIWWDSSPLVFRDFKARMLQDADAARRTGLEQQLTRLFNEDDPASSLVCGATTNPPLSLQAIERRPDLFEPFLVGLSQGLPYADAEVLWWRTYLELVRLGSAAILPIWERSNHRLGYLSAQVDPRFVRNEEVMSKHALELAAQNPNVMIKCPGTREGIRLIRRLTAKGIATNCTLCFILPQMVDVMDAVQSGLAEAKANGVSLDHWRSVITQMSARYEDRHAFDESAADEGITLTVEDKRWASVAIFRKAYQVARRRGYPGKLLFCSIRRGPVVNGRERMWHIEKIAGGSMVYTLPPACLRDLWELDANLEFQPLIEEEVPRAVLEKLLRVPYFAEAYQEEMDAGRYSSLAPMVFTENEFSDATTRTMEYVRNRVAEARAGSRPDEDHEGSHA